jgi:hypothetical protein
MARNDDNDDDRPARDDDEGTSAARRRRDRRDNGARRTQNGWCAEDIDAVQLMSNANHIVVVPDVPAVLPGTDSNPASRIEFRTGGKRTANCVTVYIIGISGSVFDSTPGSEDAGDYEMATMAFSLKTSQGLDFVTNGQAADFVRYKDIFKGSQAFFPMGVTVPTSELLYVVFRNLQPAATGHTLNPSLTFFCRLPDLE